MDARLEHTYKQLGDVLLTAFGNSETQQSLARRLYVSQVAVHNWLSGKRRPLPGILGQLAALFDISPDDLAQLAGYDCDPDALDKVLNAYHDRLCFFDKHNNRGSYESISVRADKSSKSVASDAPSGARGSRERRPSLKA
jgi:transcriptional regulator with XRE-family HTH domain